MDTLSAHEYAIHLLDPLPLMIVGEKKKELDRTNLEPSARW